MYAKRRNFRVFEEIRIEEHDGVVTSDLRPEEEIYRPFLACAMKNMQYSRYYRNSSVIVWTWLWGRYHVSQNVFLVFFDEVHSLMSNMI